MPMKNKPKKKQEHLNGQHKVLWALTGRHLEVFFKNKMTFFFSLLVPLITLIIYILFLRSLEFSSVDSVLAEFGIAQEKYADIYTQAHGLVDGWMLSGILAVSCITVSLNTCYIVISDRETGVNRDFAASPISKHAIVLSYLLFNIIVTFIICFVILAICLVYLNAVAAFYLSFTNVLLVLLTLIASILSASLITLLIASFISAGSVFNSIMAIISAGIGFLIGAYMPVKMLPKGSDILCSLFPGTYSAGILRNLFLENQFIHLSDYMLSSGISSDTINTILTALGENFSLNVSFFGTGIELTAGWMALALLCWIALSAILFIIFTSHNMNSNLFHKESKKKRKNEGRLLENEITKGDE